MPLTRLDDTAALVVIDLQKGVLGMSTVHPLGDVIVRASQLARAFRNRGLPVILVRVSSGAPGRTDVGPNKTARPADWTELVPELDQHPEDYIVTKQRVGAFIGTSLDEYLREHGVTHVVLAGVVTSMGVESTARSAFDYGYNVVRVVDVMTDRDAQTHRHAIEKIFPRLGETATAAEVLELLPSITAV